MFKPFNLLNGGELVYKVKTRFVELCTRYKFVLEIKVLFSTVRELDHHKVSCVDTVSSNDLAKFPVLKIVKC